MPSILFLDDDQVRHSHFRTRIDGHGHSQRYQMIYVHSAAEAIDALKRHEGDIVHASLDHDLCEEDVLVAVGAPSKVPTGMAVVDHILTMRQPPAKVVVHSYNTDAAIEMCSRLRRHGSIDVQRIPFSEMIGLLDRGREPRELHSTHRVYYR
jgi:CheY-like chemotaxis protein